jgi:hypothetical protein
VSGTHERLRNGFIVAAVLSAHSPPPAWPMGGSVPSVAGLPVPDEETAAGELSQTDPLPAGGEPSDSRKANATKKQSPDLQLASDGNAKSDPAPLRPQAPASALSLVKPSGGWQLAPIRIWGDLAYDFRRSSVEGQPDFTRHSAITNFNASTYIYEPWVATVTAGLGLTASRLNDGELSGSDRFVSGYARLNVFPASRFPFEARFLRSDSGTGNDAGFDQTYRLTRYGVTQRYRSEDGRDQYSARFDRFTQDSTSVGKDIQSALQLDANTRFRRDHELQLVGTWNHNRRVNTDERNDYETLLARHAFRPDSTVSWENSINLTHTTSRFVSAESDLRIFQLSSVAFWRPERQPLTANGSVRMFSLDNGTGEESSRTRVINASAGVTYSASRNLRALAGISFTDTEAGDQHNSATIGTLGATYQGDTHQLGNFRHDWFASGTGIATSGASDRDGFLFNGTLGNTLSRGFDLGNGGAITFNVAQNLSALAGAPIEGSKQLFHSGSVTWTKSEPDSNATSFIRFSATDSRYLDGQREILQLVNLQLTRALEFDRDRALSGNLTFQTTRRVSHRPGFDNSVNDGKPESTISGDLVYRHQNFFGVPRLVYFSQLRLNRQELVQALGVPGERELRSWENRLDYQIGRLETRFLARIAEIDGRRQWLLMFRVTRRF